MNLSKISAFTWEWKSIQQWVISNAIFNEVKQMISSNIFVILSSDMSDSNSVFPHWVISNLRCEWLKCSFHSLSYFYPVYWVILMQFTHTEWYLSSDIEWFECSFQCSLTAIVMETSLYTTHTQVQKELSAYHKPKFSKFYIVCNLMA